MADLTFEEVLAAARKLPPAQKAALVQTLQMRAIAPTRDELIAEMDALRAAGAFAHIESLQDKYANPALRDLSDEDLRSTIHDAATEWEQELDELFTDED